MVYVTLGSNVGDVMISQEIRRDVFVKKQGLSPEAELDGRDETSRHIIAYYNYAPAGCCRMKLLTEGALIDRLAVLEECRGLGLSRELIKYVVSYARDEKMKKLYVRTTDSCVKLFENFGFILSGDIVEQRDGKPVLMEYTDEKDI